jgi:methylthioribose-1-phosphate isomerase
MSPQEILTRNVLHSSVKTLELTPEGVRMLDQTRIPEAVVYQTITSAGQMAEAIHTMIVRGAPAIGIAGGFGIVLSARKHLLGTQQPLSSAISEIMKDAETLRASRPTAVNLMWAIDQLKSILDEARNWEESHQSKERLLEALTQKAQAILDEDIAANQKMGEYGAELVPKGGKILTHCNAGALATGGYGTALGVVRSAFAKDNTVQVFADETRPRLQGARLTTWELLQDGIPVTLITDGMSGHLMKSGGVDLVITGADRIALNGDSANKIGTYNLALVAKAHDIPFYIAAPLSTIDLNTPNGEAIPIEERHPEEIYLINGAAICPTEGLNYYNPSFDVTPAHLIAGIITEAGIARPPYMESLPALFSN